MYDEIILPPIEEDIEYQNLKSYRNTIMELRNQIKKLKEENEYLVDKNIDITNHILNYRENLDLKVKKYDMYVKKLKRENSNNNTELNKSKTIINDLKVELEELKSHIYKSDDDTSCIICFENKRNVLFKPCNHICICDTCSGNTDFEKCILCNTELIDYEYAYLS